MKVYTPEIHIQAIILACKGYLRREEDDNTRDSIDRLVRRIIGVEEDCEILDRIRNYWLYEAYDYLLGIDETFLSYRNNVRNFMLGDLVHNHIEAPFEIKVSEFLITEINLTQIYQEGEFRIELDKENEYMIR